MRTISKKLKKYREDLGIKQIYVAKALKISRSTLSKKENSKTKFNADELQILCRMYNIEDVQEVDLN